MFEVYEVPNDELDGSEELIEEFKNESDAVDFASSERSTRSNSVWVILASDEIGYEKVIST